MGKPQSVTVWLEFMYHCSIVESLWNMKWFWKHEIIVGVNFCKVRLLFQIHGGGDTNSTWSFAKNINLNSVKAEYKKNTELKEVK